MTTGEPHPLGASERHPLGAEATAQSRSARKRRAIIEAATELFLGQGYLGTSMDEIAASAAVSKQTVYKHFADKQTLFRAIVTSIVDVISDPNYEAIIGLKDSSELEPDLIELARSQLRLVMQRRVLQLRRLVIGESGRFPELGQAFYERGPGRTMAGLAEAFQGLAQRGLLQLDRDPLLAAEHFNWLVMSTPLNRAMLGGDALTPPAAELDRYAEAGARVFLAAYAPGS